MCRLVAAANPRLQQNPSWKKGLRLANHSARRLVGVLVMYALDVVQGGKEDIEEFGVEVFAPMFTHKLDGVIEGEGRLVDTLCG
ncbi:MAG: hypothetical protein KGJ48_04085, partial [Nitrospirota bacterium]|nr:hypothetical protein [Nitrospirota bacterium]